MSIPDGDGDCKLMTPPGRNLRVETFEHAARLVCGRCQAFGPPTRRPGTRRDWWHVREIAQPCFAAAIWQHLAGEEEERDDT